MLKVKAKEDTAIVSMGHLMVLTIPSILIIIILHFIKVIKLRKSQALHKDVETMNKVVTIILGIYILYHLQKNLIAVNDMRFLEQSVLISGFIHHASNPLIYAAFTPLVQKPWKRLKEGFRTG
jgi:hypothetical protein